MHKTLARTNLSVNVLILNMRSMSREKFLREFAYDVEIDFGIDDTSASWADTDQRPAHRYWADEDYRIELPQEDDFQCRLVNPSLSPDKRFIATSNGFVVALYDIATKECRMVFRGLTMPPRGLCFNPSLTRLSGYTLMIASSEMERPDSDMGLIFLELDHDGRKVIVPKSLVVDRLLEQSTNPVASHMND